MPKPLLIILSEPRINLIELREAVELYKDHPFNAEEISQLKDFILRVIPQQSTDRNKMIRELFKLNVLARDLVFINTMRTLATTSLNSDIHSLSNECLYDFFRNSVSFLDAPRTHDQSKKIHFIRFGDTLPSHLIANLSEILSVAYANGFECYLWTENPSRQEHIFNELPASTRAHLNIVDIQTLMPEIRQRFDVPIFPGCSLKKYQLFEQFLEAELHGFHNYAAASDLWRLLVVKLMGGLYLDSDLKLLLPMEAPYIPLMSNLYNELGFCQLHIIVRNEFFGRSWNDYNPRNDMILFERNHPVINEALNVWIVYYLSQQQSELPHYGNPNASFIPSVTDQRRFGLSFYETLAKRNKRRFHGFRVKELETGNLGVLPLIVAAEAYVDFYNSTHGTQFTKADYSFGYQMNVQDDGDSPHPPVLTRFIRVGNLRFEHIMEHAWLQKEKRRSNDI